MWDAASLDNIRTLEGHGNEVTALAVSPDGDSLISGSRDQKIIVWDTASLEMKKTIDFPGNIYTVGIDFSRDGKAVIVGDSSGNIMEIDMPSLSVSHTAAVEPMKSITRLW